MKIHTQKLEICINCDAAQSVADSVGASFEGGAATVELCAEMQHDGLTPTLQNIIDARKAFQERPGLMIMIRPRKGDFCYSKPEIQPMLAQIKMAAKAGADGAVFGPLNRDNTINIQALSQLTQLSKSLNLKTTFHRAFDATPDFFESLDILIAAGVDRVLTSGASWKERKPATEGLEIIHQLIEKANGRIEIVIGGGVNRENAKTILAALPDSNTFSLHAYSGAQVSGIVTKESVQALAEML